MEMSKMSARGVKVKLARKGRPAEASRKGSTSSGLGRRPARDVKNKISGKSFQTTARAPIPANDMTGVSWSQ